MNSFKAITIGALVDIIGSLLLGGTIGIVLGIYLAATGVPENELEKTLTTKMMESPWNTIGYTVGCLISIVAGYVTARITKTNVYFCAGAVGTISGIFGFYMGQTYHSTAMNGALLLLTICSVFLGAFIWSKRNTPDKTIEEGRS